MAASSSTSTSAAGNPNNKSCHVFINHRGVDVKTTFARSLYLRLLKNGLTAFLDEEEMQQGYNISSQLEYAIENATVHVAIFSPRYAESYWCLHELVMMLESKAPIIPVFYRVTPAQVRWTQGTYGSYDQTLKTLAKKRTHEGTMRYDSNTIKKWRNALSQVANNSGFELETCNGEELVLELLDKVVNCLSKMVKKPELHVAKYPTGLDEKLIDFEKTVMFGKPQKLGIVGLGGVGKTTLAKEFFNKNKSNYSKSCFLFEVRDNAAKGSLNSLQRQLLKSLTSIDKPIDNVDEGIWMLEGAFKSFNAPAILNHAENGPNTLIILDDVNSVDQVDALLPAGLGSGSLILITSRDKHVLICSKIEISSIYTLTGLNNQDSRELFCKYAFNQTYPLRGFEHLVDSFLEACKGLPLSLKVFGENLYGRDISYREEELGTFPRELEERFKISYDALDNEEQQIFLDIACFYIGKNRDTAISIWNALGWKGRRGLQNLQDKSLVEVDNMSNVILMHDHLRDLGRNVAASSSPRRLGRWTEKSIRGLEHATKLRKLRVSGCSPLEELRSLETLVSLEELLVYGCEQLKSIRGLEPLTKLHTLDVSRCFELEELPIMETLVSLEVLSAQNCLKLKSIRGLEHATKLRQLRVSGCSTLEELPSLETLVSLEELLAYGCVQLKSIRGLEQATKLRHLDVSKCSELEGLPSMETLVSLEQLWADGCVQLKSIRGLEPLTKLHTLDVSSCFELEELPSMETLVSLEVLSAENCLKLKSIRGLEHATKLRHLDVSGCSELEEVEDVEQCTWLETIDMSDCPKLSCSVWE